MTKLVDAMRTENAITENGMTTNSTTLNACVDLFGDIGAMRGQDKNRLIQLFSKAYGEDPMTAMRILFWSRDVRGGSGERQVFRDVFQSFLAVNHPDVAEKNLSIDGIAFNYLHFYGSYFTVQSGRNWYSKEVRIIRNSPKIRSYGDAQGFRKDGKKLSAIDCNARVYHYGWARPPRKMIEKIKSFHSLWHDQDWIKQNCSSDSADDYFSDLGNLRVFDGQHPKVMEHLINREHESFIKKLQMQYFKQRGLKEKLRDYLRSLPFLVHRNFILVK